MNNEEKILQLLAEMRSDMTEMKAKLEEVDQRSIRTQVLLEEVDQRSVRTQVLLEEVDQRSVRTQVLLETEVMDKLQLLFDGHKTILETLAPKSRVEVLEDDVSFMKTVIKAMSQEIAELKKAQ